jgi:hypothetical protein
MKDKLVCINDSNDVSLTLGEIYTKINDHELGYLMRNNAGEIVVYNTHRFETIEESRRRKLNSLLK